MKPAVGKTMAKRWSIFCLAFALGSGVLSAQEDAPAATLTEASDTNPLLESSTPIAKSPEVSPEESVPATTPHQEHLPQAKSVDLGEPVWSEESTTTLAEPEVPLLPAPVEAAIADTPPLILLGKEVPPLTSTRLSWSPEQSFEGLSSPTPVLVVHGGKTGPTLCITAALHGDEINGIEIVRRVLYEINPEGLNGSVIGVPIVNIQGFQRNSRYLPDRRDLNRYFPGYLDGSSASRIAFSFFNEVIKHCSALIDLHTGSFDRTNLPQLRADLTNAAVLELTQGFEATTVLHSTGSAGTLRRSATEHGIPAVTIEAGGPMRLQEEAIKHSVKGIKTLMNHLGMISKPRLWGTREPVYYKSRWIRADSGGILQSDVKLGERVDQGDLLGTITNPITNVRSRVVSPLTGRVLGMAYDQVVMPGYAAYHLGITTPAEVLPASDQLEVFDQPQDAEEDETIKLPHESGGAAASQKKITETPDDLPDYD